MTSLTAEAASFFSRSASCVTGQSSLQDIARAVSASFAAVGGMPRIDLDHGAPSVFRFGAQNRDELSPARGVPATQRVQLPVSLHAANAMCWCAVGRIRNLQARLISIYPHDDESEA